MNNVKLVKKELISREAWLIRLMQGMIGDYGNGCNPTDCYYSLDGSFRGKDKETKEDRELNLSYMRTDKFWITNTKGIDVKKLEIINIDGETYESSN